MPRYRLTGYAGSWVFLWVGLLVVSLYSRPPLPVDETRYLSVAWEMWQSNHFLVPHINGQPYSHKPPLLFWLIHLGWWLFGVNPISARVTAPLFCLGSIFLTQRLGKILWPGKEIITKTVPYILLGMGVWSFYGTLTIFDMLVVFFSLTAYAGTLLAMKGRKLAGWSIVSLAIGLGILAKGPVILIFTFPVAVLAPWWGKEESISWRRWYWGFILALGGGFVLALSWAIPAALSGGTEYSQAIFLNQTAGRVINSFAHQRPFYWYCLFLPLILFPWFFWPPAWKALQKLHLELATRFCLSIIVPAFFLLSLVSGKQIHYLLPLLPIIALLTARAFAEPQVVFSWSRWPLSFFLIILGAVLLAAPHLGLQGGDTEMLAFIPSWFGLIPVTAGILLLYIFSRGTGKPVLWIAHVHVLLMIFLQLALFFPVHTLYDPSAIAKVLDKKQEDGFLVAVTPPRLKDQFQFAGRLTTPLIPLDNLEEVAEWSKLHPKQYCLLLVEDKNSSLLSGDGEMARYSNGHLIFRSAKGFNNDLAYWESKK